MNAQEVPNDRKRVATPTGFEPAISALTGQYVKPLHHGAASGSLSNLYIEYSGMRGGWSRLYIRRFRSIYVVWESLTGTRRTQPPGFAHSRE